jgi:hypothetical protein
MTRSSPAKRTASGRLLGSREPMPGAHSFARDDTHRVGLPSSRVPTGIPARRAGGLHGSLVSVARWIRAWRSSTEIALDTSSAARPHCV